MENYKKRIVDRLLVRKLEGKGAVLIQGPTAVGSYAYRRADGVYIVPVGCLKD